MMDDADGAVPSKGSSPLIDDARPCDKHESGERVFDGRMSTADSTKNTIISAVSNLSTAYNLTVINVVHVFVENQYCGGDQCGNEVDAASTSCLVGAILGQLTFGYVGDLLGRGPALRLCMALSIFGALVSAFAVPINSDPASIFIFLAISRFVLGVGVGGVYPLSATIAAESSDKAARGRSSALVFSMQGVANLMVPLIAMLFLTMTDEDDWESWVDKDGNFSGLSWRLALGFGAIPGLLIAPFKTAETKKPTAPAAEATSQRTTSSSALTLSQALCMKEYWGKLLGCAGGWFLFDITFYGNTLFQSTVLKQVFDTNDDADDGAPVAISGSLQENVCAQMAVVAAIALPGYYVSAYFMDKLGRRNIQLMGFCVMAILFVILGVWVKELGDTPTLMLILYSLTFFFSNFGPNSTTFILPAETFPSNMRTTMNGFCAAMGKLGATIGSGAFKPLADATSLGTTMIVCGIVSVLGAIVTYFFVEDCRGKDMDGSTNDPVAVNGDSETGDVYSPLPYAEA